MSYQFKVGDVCITRNQSDMSWTEELTFEPGSVVRVGKSHTNDDCFPVELLVGAVRDKHYATTNNQYLVNRDELIPIEDYTKEQSPCE